MGTPHMPRRVRSWTAVSRFVLLLPALLLCGQSSTAMASVATAPRTLIPPFSISMSPLSSELSYDQELMVRYETERVLSNYLMHHNNETWSLAGPQQTTQVIFVGLVDILNYTPLRSSTSTSVNTSNPIVGASLAFDGVVYYNETTTTYVPTSDELWPAMTQAYTQDALLQALQPHFPTVQSTTVDLHWTSASPTRSPTPASTTSAPSSAAPVVPATAVSLTMAPQPKASTTVAPTLQPSSVPPTLRTSSPTLPPPPPVVATPVPVPPTLTPTAAPTGSPTRSPPKTMPTAAPTGSPTRSPPKTMPTTDPQSKPKPLPTRSSPSPTRSPTGSPITMVPSVAPSFTSSASLPGGAAGLHASAPSVQLHSKGGPSSGTIAGAAAAGLLLFVLGLMCLARHRRRHQQQEEQGWKNTDAADADAVAATALGAGAGVSLSSSNQDDDDDPKNTSLIIFNHHDGNSPTSSPPPPTPPVPTERKTLSSLYDQIVHEYGMDNGLRGEEKKEQEGTTLKDLPPDDDHHTPQGNKGGFWAGLYQSLSRTAQSPPAQNNNDDPAPPHLAMTEGSGAEQDSDLDGMSEWQSSDADADADADASSSLGFDAGPRAGEASVASPTTTTTNSLGSLENSSSGGGTYESCFERQYYHPTQQLMIRKDLLESPDFSAATLQQYTRPLKQQPSTQMLRGNPSTTPMPTAADQFDKCALEPTDISAATLALQPRHDEDAENGAERDVENQQQKQRRPARLGIQPASPPRGSSATTDQEEGDHVAQEEVQEEAQLFSSGLAGIFRSIWGHAGSSNQRTLGGGGTGETTDDDTFGGRADWDPDDDDSLLSGGTNDNDNVFDTNKMEINKDEQKLLNHSLKNESYKMQRLRTPPTAPSSADPVDSEVTGRSSRSQLAPLSPRELFPSNSATSLSTHKSYSRAAHDTTTPKRASRSFVQRHHHAEGGASYGDEYVL